MPIGPNYCGATMGCPGWYQRTGFYFRAWPIARRLARIAWRRGGQLNASRAKYGVPGLATALRQGGVW